MAIPLAQQRKLLQRSGNMCAFPGCRLLLTAEGTPEDPVVVTGRDRPYRCAGKSGRAARQVAADRETAQYVPEFDLAVQPASPAD